MKSISVSLREADPYTAKIQKEALKSCEMGIIFEVNIIDSLVEAGL